MTPRFRTMGRLLPSWLREGDGELVSYSLGVILDAFLTRMHQGVHARFPGHAPEDALAYLGRDRKIVRGINEPAEAYAARLVRWLADHRRRGSAFALMDQLAAYLQIPLRIRTVDTRGTWFTREGDGSTSVFLDRANWDWDGAPPAEWGKFWVILYPPAELWVRDGTWGDGEVWGGTPSQTWGSTASPEEVVRVRSIVRTWKPAHARCVSVIVSFDDAAFAPGDTSPPLPDGSWLHWSKLDAGVQVPARDVRAIYWDGVQ